MLEVYLPEMDTAKTLGFTSNAGFSIITNNGKGLPDIDNKTMTTRTTK
jgi:hypothetical protein